MHKSILAAAAMAWLLVVGGCTSQPVLHGPDARSPHLVQLSDIYFVDLGDVKQAMFVRPTAPSETFNIQIWHAGAADNTFLFTFSDEASAYVAWKRVVADLGGSLQEEDWKASTKPAVVQASVPSQSPTLFQQQAAQQGSAVTGFSIFGDDLAALTACRDEKLITSEEYQRGHDRKLADFVASAGNGSGYNAVFSQMHEELVQLAQMQAAKGDHLLSDADIAAMHKTIVARYIPAPE